MIVVGLGNPGHQYALTRHNLGWRVVEALVTTLGGPEWQPEHHVRWSKLGEHWVIEPYDFMNDSGPALKSFMDWREIGLEPSRLIVVHDDLDLELGRLKPDVNRSAAGHRGVQSLIDALNTQDFRRLRLGIGSNRPIGIPAEAYVLQHFTPDEQPVVNDMITAAVAELRRELAA